VTPPVPPSIPKDQEGSSWPSRVAAVLLFGFGFLPLADWLPGNRDIGMYRHASAEWLNAGLIVAGGGFVLAMLLRSRSESWRGTISRVLTPVIARSSTVVGIAVLALAAYLLVASEVFSRRPLIIDEIVQVVQAKMMASGHLWVPTPAHPEFTSVLNIVNAGGKTYSHFPPGGPAVLALGELVAAPWIMGPLMGCFSVLLFAWLLRAVEPRVMVRRLALLLFAFCPFTAFMAGSHMNHVSGLTFLLLGMAGTAHALTGRRRPLLAIFVGGLGFGLAAATRPLDAVAFALPAAAWFLVVAARDRTQWRLVPAAALGVAIPVAALLTVQSLTTGSAFRMAYEVMWGSNVGLGFHGTPWGDRHTPMMGLELISRYFVRLQIYLFESSVPSLIPAMVALWLTRGLRAADRYLLAAAALLIGCYLAYWHDGFFLGPRFFYPLLPALAVWSARFPSAVADRFGRRQAYWSVVYGALIAIGIAVAINIPLRVRQYSNSFTTSRWDADAAAKQAGVSNALVFVRESFGAEVIARMWGLGVPPGAAEQVYKHVDACALHQALAKVESLPASQRPTGPQLGQALQGLMGDSARLIHSPFSPDTTELVLPGSRYTAACLRRIADDRRGFTLYPPLLVARSDNVFVRDLPGRNGLMLDAYPDRPVYLLRPSSTELGSVPRFEQMSRDSLRVN
jgi:hypothetical protein